MNKWMLFIFRVTAVILFIVLTYLIFKEYYYTGKIMISLVGAYAILISALLASYSVMFSIDNTDKAEEIQDEKNRKTNIFYLTQNILDIQQSIKKYNVKEIGYETFDSIKSLVEKKVALIEDKNILYAITEQEAVLLLKLRLELYELISIPSKSDGLSLNRQNAISDKIEKCNKYISDLLLEISQNHKVKLPTGEIDE